MQSIMRFPKILVAMALAFGLQFAPLTTLSPAAHAQQPAATTKRAKLTQRQLANNVVRATTARLSIMYQVAWNKFVTKSAVEDPSRNQVVIDSFVAATASAKVRKKAATAIAKDQIAAAVSVEYSLIAQWSMGLLTPPQGTPPTLESLRDVINTATADLAKAVRQAKRHAKPASWSSKVQAAEARQQRHLPTGVNATILRQALEAITYDKL